LAEEYAARWSGSGAGKPRVCAVVLDPSPGAILKPATAPARLTTFVQRAKLLRECGADAVVRIDVNAGLMAMSPGEFLDAHIKPLNPVGIVEGPDFRFGKSRAGDIRTVVEHFGRADFVVATPEQVEVAMTDLSVVPARSTMARWLLSNGRVRDAAVVLGRAHVLEGRVVPGDQRGRTIGYPTANIDTECMLPGDGVYGAWATLPSGRRLMAALSVGVKPTFDGAKRTAEAFLMDDGQRGAAWKPLEGLSEYGWDISLEIVTRVRDQQKFAGLSGLVAQIERDCAVIADVLGSETRSTGRREALV
jgi:riboflavin kinase / FMN adenylyltransferase